MPTATEAAAVAAPMTRLFSAALGTPPPGSNRWANPRKDHAVGSRSGNRHSPANAHRTSGTKGRATRAAAKARTTSDRPGSLPTAPTEVPGKAQVEGGDHPCDNGDQDVYGHRRRPRGQVYLPVLVVGHDRERRRVGLAEKVGNLEGPEREGEDEQARRHDGGRDRGKDHVPESLPRPGPERSGHLLKLGRN